MTGSEAWTTRTILVEVEVTEGRIGSNRGAYFERAIDAWLGPIRRVHERLDLNWMQFRIVGWHEKEETP